MAAFERVSGRTFPPLKPGKSFYAFPSFYVGNHTSFVGEDESFEWQGLMKETATSAAFS